MRAAHSMPVSILHRASALLAGLMLLLMLAACDAGGSGSTGSGENTSGTTPGGLQIALLTEPSPPKAGNITVIVEVKDTQGQPLDDARVTLDADMPSMGHGGIKGELVPAGNGRYSAQGSFSMSGSWRLNVSVSKGDMAPQTQSFNITVR